jgi:hypothetical protein
VVVDTRGSDFEFDFVVHRAEMVLGQINEFPLLFVTMVFGRISTMFQQMGELVLAK